VVAAVPASATTLTAGQLVAIATGAPMSLPYAVAVDTAGDVFIANTYASEIDEITASTGVLSLVAGGGILPPSTTPITATSAHMGDAQGIAVNASGTLVYIADSSHFDIEELNISTGDLSVIAGNGVTGASTAGPPTSSHLDQPEAVAVDVAGDVFIADSYNDEVDEVSALTGDLSVIAGKGVPGPPLAGLATNSHLNRPTGLAVSAAGTLVYIADQGNDTIDEITNPGPTGSLSVIAGQGMTTPSTTPVAAATTVLNYPDCVAVDAAGNLYISDMDDFEFEEISGSTGDLSVIAGGGGTAPSTTPVTATAAVFNQPRGVAVDTVGNIYISDAGTNQIDELGHGRDVVRLHLRGRGVPGADLHLVGRATLAEHRGQYRSFGGDAARGQYRFQLYGDGCERVSPGWGQQPVRRSHQPGGDSTRYGPHHDDGPAGNGTARASADRDAEHRPAGDVATAGTYRWWDGSNPDWCRLLGPGPGRLAVQSWQRR
jgi:DNA-binding beta-propeller fold protein YncE